MTDSSAPTVADMVKLCAQLSWVSGRTGAERELGTSPGTQTETILVGYMNPVHPHPIQIVGPAEIEHLAAQDSDTSRTLLELLFSHKNSLAVIVAGGTRPSQEMITLADRSGVALLTSTTAAPKLIAVLQYLLTDLLMPRTLEHGVMMAVYGLGVLITGSSGIGKSELGLELLSRNHRLVADDAVEIRRTPKDELVASCPENLCGHLEVRGLGILNIREMFGYAAVLTERRLDLIVQLQRLQAGKESKLDRLQIQRARQDILGLERPRVSLIIAPGRNLAVLVEAAVRDCILRMRGRNASAEFVDKQLQAITNSVPKHDNNP